MRYAAPWDRSLRVSTGALLAVLAFAAVVALLVARALGGVVAGALGAFALAVLAAVALAGWALAPTGYAVEEGTLRIERRLRPLSIPLARATAVARVAELWALGAARIGGSAGFFGHYGSFWNRGLGSFRLYATRTHDLVLLEFPDDRLVVSPDAPERFVEEVCAAAPGATRVQDPEALGRRAVPRGVKVAVGAAVAAVPVLVAAVLFLTTAWAPVGAHVEGSVIEIERRHALPVEIPLARVHGVEVLATPGGFRRIAGFQGPGISYGRFASEDLGEFQLYDWGGPAYVLLQTDGGPVLLTPDDPDRFVAAVRKGMKAP
ncbi:MAG TPA: PH domain-containing protein [Anaeromyxobacter sp.]